MIRNNLTLTEKTVWEQLKGKKILGLRFRPQHPIDIFIADFYCHPLRLVIEIDGGIHKNREQKEYDLGREGELENLGITVIRFTNQEVENDLTNIIARIKKTCKNRLSEISQSPL